MLGAERVWFGIESNRRLLETTSFDGWRNLLQDLHGSIDVRMLPDHRHALYRNAAEAMARQSLLPKRHHEA